MTMHPRIRTELISAALERRCSIATIVLDILWTWAADRILAKKG